MAIRLLPFRQYSEHEVVNLFSSLAANDKLSDSGNGDAGVFVKVTNGNANDPTEYITSSYLGKTDYPFVGRDQYPQVPLKVDAAGSGDMVLGVTLNQTALHDENGEKLLYYPQKALENQAVLSGQAVPVLTRGILTLDVPTAFAVKTDAAVGTALTVSGEGKLCGTNTLVGHHHVTTGVSTIGRVIATGTRVNRGVATDQFAGASIGTGAAAGEAYAIVQFDCINSSVGNHDLIV
tara:strand:- start:87 stop:791 length:705 start_codon:yes stop_codon:yes gene_type:complete